MKRIYGIICFFLILFAGCLDDKSVYVNEHLNMPQWKTNSIILEFRTGETAVFKGSTYFSWATDSLKRASEVRYEWVYNNVVIGEEVDFEIPTNELLNKISMTKLDNENHYALFNIIEKETGVTYSMTVSFKVLSNYASGDWVVVSEKGGNTKLSYIRRQRTDEGVKYILTEDVYFNANGEDILGRPLRLVRSEGSTNIGTLGSLTIVTTDNVYEVNSENFVKVGNMEDAPCRVVLRTDGYGMFGDYGQHTFVTDEEGKMYRRMMTNNNLGGSFELTPMVLDNKGYSIKQLGMQRQQFVSQPCWDELNRRLVFISFYESAEYDDNPWFPQPSGEVYKLSKLTAPIPVSGGEGDISKKCAPVWNMPEGTEILEIVYASSAGNPFTGYNDLWTIVYNDINGDTYLSEFLISQKTGFIIDGNGLINIPFPGGNLTRDAHFMASYNRYEPYYNKDNFFVYSKGDEIRWLDRSQFFKDNSYIKLPDAADNVTYMGWTAWANYSALVVGTEKGKLYIYDARVSNGSGGTSPLKENPEILAEFDLGGKVISAKELDNERTSYDKIKY